MTCDITCRVASSQRISLPLCQILSVFCKAMGTPKSALIITWSPTTAGYERTTSFRPQPAERPGGEQGEDEAVQDMLGCHAPLFTFPDRVLNQRDGIGQKCAAAGHAEDFEVGSSGRAGASGQISDEDSDHDAV